MPTLTRRFSLLILASLLTLVGCDHVAEKGHQIQVLADGEALYKDAQEYAKDQSVSIDEAVERLAGQRDIGKFDTLLSLRESETYGGLWIQHKPEYKVIVNMTDELEKVYTYAQGVVPANLVEARKVKKSMRQLKDEQSEALNVTRTLGLPAESGIDVYQNRVNLQVLDKDKLDSLLSAARGLSIPEGVVITEVAGFSSAGQFQTYGGTNMSDCTAGFSVRDSHGLRGISTAGHCQNSQSNAGVTMRLIHEWWSGSTDVQWHTSNGVTFQPWGKDNEPNSGGTAYYREIYSNVNGPDQPIGGFFCKYGRVTGYTCGYLRDKNILPDDMPNGRATFFRLDNGSRILTKKGDSGGPVYEGHAALGTTYGGYFIEGNPRYGDHLYMSINHLTDTGLIVLHAPR